MTNVPGAQTERRGEALAGECPSSRLGLTGRFSVNQGNYRGPENAEMTGFSLCVLDRFGLIFFLLFQFQQLRGFGAEAAEFFILRLVLLHPTHRLVVPLPSLV